MKRASKLFALLISVLLVAGCSGGGDTTTTPLSPPDLTSEEGIIEYLVGEWVYDYYDWGDVICTMNIDQELNVSLSFENSYSELPKGEYKGKIHLERVHADSHEAPDNIRIELIDSDEYGGDFYFLHRTIYDGKRVMSWFFSAIGNYESVFDLLDVVVDFKSLPNEMMFEKQTGEDSYEDLRLDDSFYAVYWGMGEDNKSLWLDDVWFTPPYIPEEDEYQDYYPPIYPPAMTFYENNGVLKSVLYSIDPDEITEVLGDDIAKGEVYFVTVDGNGNIIEMLSAERYHFLMESSSSYDYGLNSQVAFDIEMYMSELYETQEYLNSGMEILVTGESVIIDGEPCYYVFLGTNHEESFVREVIYAVNASKWQVYLFDVANDKWEALGLG
jgi:hypothetical protein